MNPVTNNAGSTNDAQQVAKPRGFAAMSRERQREIASLGGRAAHMSGHAHEFTPEEASAAGKKRHKNGATGTATTS